MNARPVQAVVLALLALAGVLAACGTASLGVRDEGNAGTASASIPVNEVQVPGPEVTVIRTVPETAETAETSEVTTATTVPELPATDEAARPPVIYLFRYGRPEAVAVEQSAEDSSGRSLLDALLAPLTPAQRSLRYTTSIPEGTTVRSYIESEDTATVDLSPEFAGADANAVYQLVYTLTTRPGLRQVAISVDGVPFDLGGGLTGPVTRDLADVLVRAPATPTTVLEGEPCDLTTAPAQEPGQPPFYLAVPKDRAVVAAGEPLRLIGYMRLPDDVLVFRVIQYRTEVAHAISTAGCEGRFEWTMELPAGVTGPVTLEAYSPAEDGTKRWQTVRRLEIE